jgi:hypothetical protein
MGFHADPYPLRSLLAAMRPSSLPANPGDTLYNRTKRGGSALLQGVLETMNAVFCLALGVSLSTAASIALGPQSGGTLLAQTLLAQTTGSTPSAGVLVTPLPAPVSVPPSGVLAAVEGGAVGARPFNVVHRRPLIRGAALRRAHHHPVPVRTAHSPTSQAAIGRVETPLVVKSPPEQPNQVGADTSFSLFGKGKE